MRTLSSSSSILGAYATCTVREGRDLEIFIRHFFPSLMVMPMAQSLSSYGSRNTAQKRHLLRYLLLRGYDCVAHVRRFLHVTLAGLGTPRGLAGDCGFLSALDASPMNFYAISTSFLHHPSSTPLSRTGCARRGSGWRHSACAAVLLHSFRRPGLISSRYVVAGRAA